MYPPIEIQLQHVVGRIRSLTARFTSNLGGPVSRKSMRIRRTVPRTCKDSDGSMHGSDSYIPRVAATPRCRGMHGLPSTTLCVGPRQKGTTHVSLPLEKKLPGSSLVVRGWFGFDVCGFSRRNASMMDEVGRIDVRTCHGLVGEEQTGSMRLNDPWRWTSDAADRI